MLHAPVATAPFARADTSAEGGFRGHEFNHKAIRRQPMDCGENSTFCTMNAYSLNSTAVR